MLKINKFSPVSGIVVSGYGTAEDKSKVKGPALRCIWSNRWTSSISATLYRRFANEIRTAERRPIRCQGFNGNVDGPALLGSQQVFNHYTGFKIAVNADLAGCPFVAVGMDQVKAIAHLFKQNGIGYAFALGFIANDPHQLRIHIESKWDLEDVQNVLDSAD